MNEICANLEKIIPSMAAIGLVINPDKCEIIAPAGEVGYASITKIQQLLPGASVFLRVARMYWEHPYRKRRRRGFCKKRKKTLKE